KENIRSPFATYQIPLNTRKVTAFTNKKTNNNKYEVPRPLKKNQACLAVLTKKHERITKTGSEVSVIIAKKTDRLLSLLLFRLLI
ncbi:hypothetical protein J4V27_19080, partial [Escherichia coli]